MAPTESPNSESVRFSVYCCAALIFVVIGRIQEIFLFLQPLQPGLLLLLVTMIATYSNGRFSSEITGSKASKLLGLFWFFSFFTIFFSVWPGDAFRVWKIVVSINYLFFLSCLANMRSPREIIVLSNALIASVVILAAKVLLSPTSVEAGRLSASSTYDANDLAMIIVMTLPFVMTFFFSKQPRARINYGLIMLILTVALLKTGSRGGFIGFGVVGITFLFSDVWDAGTGKRIFFALFAAVIIFNIAPESLWERFQAILSGSDYNLQPVGNGEGSDFGRIEIWKAGVKLFRQHPFLGVGPGQFATALGETFGSQYWRTAHNSFVQVAGDLGIPGIVLFSAILRRIWQNLKTARTLLAKTSAESRIVVLPQTALIALLGYLTCSLFLSQAYTAMIPLLMAYSSALHLLAEETDERFWVL